MSIDSGAKRRAYSTTNISSEGGEGRKRRIGEEEKNLQEKNEGKEMNRCEADSAPSPHLPRGTAEMRTAILFASVVVGLGAEKGKKKRKEKNSRKRER